jgi:PAS domain S-box-containing protein
MQKWGLKETNLPAGSVLINRRLSFWQLYRRYALTALFLFLAQALAIVALLWQRTNRRRIQAELIWRLELESLLAELSTLFIDLPEEEIEKNIECGLVRLGQFLRFDRISLLEFSPDRKALRTLCSWNSPEIAPAPAVLNTEQVGWCTQQLLRGEICLISDLKAIPKEACAEKGYYHQNGVASGASVPLKLGGEINGVITFVAARRPVFWTDTLITQLRTIGEIFWNALQRKHTMEALSLSRATLRESEERFRLVANTAPVLIWMSGTDTLRTYFNQPWLEFTGRPIHEELGDGWTASIHPEDLETCLGTYSKSFHQRAPFQMSYRLARHDGEYRWLLDHGVPRFNTDGSFAGYIGSVIDVTERKEAETVLSTVSRKLIEAHEEERTWIARELHDDFIQRISLLAVNLDRLTKEIPIAKAEMRHSMEEACERVSSLASDIQALSHRLHSSKLEYLGLVAACRGVCRELSDQQGVEIDFCAADVPKTLPEEVSLCLFRVLQEALQNAAKHSGSRQFKVWIKCEESEIELSVHDSGTGFDPASAFKGRGLGLISMGERVKLVDGQLFIESIPQHGTTILARVPISPKPLSKEARAQISAIGMQNALLNKPFAKPPNLCAGSASIKG